MEAGSSETLVTGNYREGVPVVARHVLLQRMGNILSQSQKAQDGELSRGCITEQLVSLSSGKSVNWYSQVAY
ncbi:hypothetical protein Mapa_010342 [Marchantia paleacea]|nr:hypothetical protein Mapa_010342 [Marchantia paleacea]